MDRLSPVDASFLDMEDDVNHLHVASVARFEGPAPSLEELRALVEGRLPLVPRYRQRVQEVPWRVGRPVWVDDPHFSLDYHLRQTALPAPGNDEQLRNLAGRILSQRLDRTKPLWEMEVVEGPVGAWVLISKVHQSLVDGVMGTDLLTMMLDEAPDLQRPVPDRWQPSTLPSSRQLVTDALFDYLGNPAEQWRMARSVAAAASKGVRAGVTLARGAAAMVTNPHRAGDSALVGPIGPHRRWTMVSASLERMGAIRGCLGGRVNDVVLTAVTNGLRQLLLAGGETVHGRTMRALVPVSVRRGRERGPYHNLIAPMFVDLPLGVEEPIEQLAAVRRQTAHTTPYAVTAASLTSMANYAPPLLLALGTRLAVRTARRLGPAAVETIITNVPGPQEPRYVLGRRLLATYPCGPLVAPVRVGVSVFSYDGQLSFGLTADYDAVGDLEPACAGITGALEELAAAAGAAGTAGPTVRPAGR